MERSRKRIAAVVVIAVSTWATPVPAQVPATATVKQKRTVTIEGRPLSDWITSLEDENPAMRKRAVEVLGNGIRGRVDAELVAIQDAIRGVMFGDRDRAVREAATASLLELSRIPEPGPQGRGDARSAIVFDRRPVNRPPTMLRLIDTEGRPVAGAVVGISFTRDGDHERFFTPTEGTESRTSDERGETSLKLSVPPSFVEMDVYAIRRDTDRSLVGLARVALAESGEPVTLVMHPPCRVRLRVECPGFRDLETQYHAELSGPNWSRSALVRLGQNVRSLTPLSTNSTTGELEFLLPPGRYTIVASGADAGLESRSVEIQPAHRVRSLGIVELTPSRLVQQGDFRGFWRSSRADLMERLDQDATDNRLIFRRPRSGPDLKGVPLGIRDVAFSPDGTLLATAHGYNDRPGEVKLWDTRTGTLAATLPGPHAEDGMRSLAFAPDGKTLAGVIGSMHNLQSPSSIILWDVNGHQVSRVLPGHQASITDLAFAPDGRILASGGADRMVRYWDVSTGRETGRFEVDPEWPEAIAYAPDGKTLAVANGETLMLWDVPGNRRRATLEPGGFCAQSLAFAPDGRTLAAAGMSLGPPQGQVRLYDMTPNPPARRAELTQKLPPPRLPGPFPFTDVAFTPDGRRLAAIAVLSLAIWDAATGVELQSLERRTGSTADRLDISADGRWLAVMQVQSARLLEVPQSPAP